MGAPGPPRVGSEIPLLSSFLYLLGWAERVRRMPLVARRHGVLAPSAQGCGQAAGRRLPVLAGSPPPPARSSPPAANVPRVIRFEDTARRGV